MSRQHPYWHYFLKPYTTRPRLNGDNSFTTKDDQVTTVTMHLLTELAATMHSRLPFAVWIWPRLTREMYMRLWEVEELEQQPCYCVECGCREMLLQLMHSVAGRLACLVCWATFEGHSRSCSSHFPGIFVKRYDDSEFTQSCDSNKFSSASVSWMLAEDTKSSGQNQRTLWLTAHKRQQELHVCAYSLVLQSLQGPCQMAW